MATARPWQGSTVCPRRRAAALGGRAGACPWAMAGSRRSGAGADTTEVPGTTRPIPGLRLPAVVDPPQPPLPLAGSQGNAAAVDLRSHDNRSPTARDWSIEGRAGGPGQTRRGGFFRAPPGQPFCRRSGPEPRKAPSLGAHARRSRSPSWAPPTNRRALLLARSPRRRRFPQGRLFLRSTSAVSEQARTISSPDACKGRAAAPVLHCRGSGKLAPGKRCGGGVHAQREAFLRSKSCIGSTGRRCFAQAVPS